MVIPKERKHQVMISGHIYLTPSEAKMYVLLEKVEHDLYLYCNRLMYSSSPIGEEDLKKLLKEVQSTLKKVRDDE